MSLPNSNKKVDDLFCFFNKYFVYYPLFIKHFVTNSTPDFPLHSLLIYSKKVFFLLKLQKTAGTQITY